MFSFKKIDFQKNLLKYSSLDDEMTLKRLKNIRKIQERKKKKDADDDNNDADSDDESEFRIKSKPKTMDEILAMTDAGLEDNDEDEENDSKKKVHTIIVIYLVKLRVCKKT